ncbi:MAG: rRNA (cytosine1402-N4)-methyltransferase [Actinomycetota bacterium]|jgi:16S rRNA (cytosine1402-N4)-methyltransferase|nr:rRNA (cytosine1402-N4)-methyltransferase [Actinomycetota bacterium]
MSASESNAEHLPVMVEEVVDVFRPVPAGVIVDATVGAGGHTSAILSARPDLSVIGLDRDEDALTMASAATARFGGRVTLVHARFDTLADAVRDHVHERGHDGVSGVLFDLGVSSMQLDRADRGFSYRGEGPIDMRMDRTQPFSAANVVNEYPFEPLAELISVLGGERFAARIAHAIIDARPLSTTVELAAVVRGAIPAPARRRGGDPARRTFQAIRMEVNSELAVIPRALDQALDLLVPGGRVAVLAYHSGEDRLVKEKFVFAATGGCVCPPGLPCGCGAEPDVRLVWRGAHKPSAAEIAVNRRAESARLRVVEKLQQGS